VGRGFFNERPKQGVFQRKAETRGKEIRQKVIGTAGMEGWVEREVTKE
jgi:hypothetical protein